MGKNKLQSLTEVFNERFFRIPDFQRGYSWGEIQLEDFWEDLINLKDNKIHYTGLLTVDPISESSIQNIEKWQDDLWLFKRSMNAYYLIDGQQRLTTSIILINEILNCFEDAEGINFENKTYWSSKFLFKEYDNQYKSYVFGYEKDNPSDEYFKTKILTQESSTSDKVPEETLYTSNLNKAKEFFTDNLKSFSKKELEVLFQKLTTKFKYNFYEIDDELDVYVTFETMNNRGKPLTNLELLKNRLIYLSTMLDCDKESRNRLRKDINETWKTIYEYLGKNKLNRMDDDDFLRNHWIMYFKYDRKESASYAKYLLNKKFTSKNAISGNLKLGDIKNYIDSLFKCVKSWFFMFNPQFSNYSDETKEWLQKLNRLSMSAFPPLFMASMAKSENEEFLPLLKSAEKFIFLVFRLTQRQANTKNSHFYRLANSYYFCKDNTTLQSVIDNVDFLTLGESGEGEDYAYHGWFNPKQFQNYLQEQYDKNQGFYSWNGLRYFLFEYELYQQDNAKGNQKVSWNDFTKRKREDSIEHIYPQTPKDECWTSNFSSFSKKQQNVLLHSLGNLVIIAKSKNSELQNKCFSFKKCHVNNDGKEIGFYNGSYSEIEVSSFEKWTANSIETRGLRMMDFMERRWGVELSEWIDVSKDKILHLDFLHPKNETEI
jgi:uncharacterized protein with ParB-like and HNH nuclease domain